MNLSHRQTQKCPRCGAKALISQHKCPECGLLFAKLDEATNKAAAERYKAHEREAIVFTKKIPPDLKRWKLIVYATTLGLFGAHYFYTRRWWWGILYLLGFTLLSVCTIFNAYFMSTTWGETLIKVLAIVVGIYGICWLADVVKVCLGRFKIPVSLPKKELNAVTTEESK